MNFSLTFTKLKVNGSYAGIGSFIKYIPIRGRGNYNFDVYSKSLSLYFSNARYEFLMMEFPSRFHDKHSFVCHFQAASIANH